MLDRSRMRAQPRRRRRADRATLRAAVRAAQKSRLHATLRRRRGGRRSSCRAARVLRGGDRAARRRRRVIARASRPTRTLIDAHCDDAATARARRVPPRQSPRAASRSARAALRFAADQVLAAHAASGLGARRRVALHAPFEPEAGAYAGGHHAHSSDARHAGIIHDMIERTRRAMSATRSRSCACCSSRARRCRSARYSYSQGLEAAVDAGIVRDAATRAALDRRRCSTHVLPHGELAGARRACCARCRTTAATFAALARVVPRLARDRASCAPRREQMGDAHARAGCATSASLDAALARRADARRAAHAGRARSRSRATRTHRRATTRSPRTCSRGSRTRCSPR